MQLWGCEPWNPSFKDSNYDDEQEEENCSSTHGEAEKFLSIGQEQRGQNCWLWRNALQDTTGEKGKCFNK